MHPLTPFAYWGESAPYTAEHPRFYWQAQVVAVRSKTGLVAARRGGIAHLDDGVAAIFLGGRAQFGARFLCGSGSRDVAVLPNAKAYGGICERCVDIAAGLCVYRCYDASDALLYIGSTECRIKRLQIHGKRTSWWPEVADIKIQRFPTIFEASAAERLAILAENPLHNKIPRRRGAA